jgi:hypothetical protein
LEVVAVVCGSPILAEVPTDGSLGPALLAAIDAADARGDLERPVDQVKEQLRVALSVALREPFAGPGLPTRNVTSTESAILSSAIGVTAIMTFLEAEGFKLDPLAIDAGATSVGVTTMVDVYAAADGRWYAYHPEWARDITDAVVRLLATHG